jgi:hypothetical protein
LCRSFHVANNTLDPSGASELPGDRVGAGLASGAIGAGEDI